MPKIIELTFELYVNKVSCPGVWLCQDGMVNLTVFALGSTYETCMAPPIFPINFKEVFYFQRRFQETCSLNNMFCLLKDETIYCELVQWSSMCGKRSIILAQYLGALNDVLFPSNYCSIEGVDLLMRRSKKFPGILAPKIEIATKVRIDQLYEQSKEMPSRAASPSPCTCIAKAEMEPGRQKSVCHTPQYHRFRCNKHNSYQSRSFLDIAAKESRASCQLPHCKFRSRTSVSSKHQERCREYHQYHVLNTDSGPTDWSNAALKHKNQNADISEPDVALSSSDQSATIQSPHENEEPIKVQLKSRLIPVANTGKDTAIEKMHNTRHVAKISPCSCEICQRYHELFHAYPLATKPDEQPKTSKSLDGEPIHCRSIQTPRSANPEKRP